MRTLTSAPEGRHDCSPGQAKRRPGCEAQNKDPLSRWLRTRQRLAAQHCQHSGKGVWALSCLFRAISHVGLANPFLPNLHLATLCHQLNNIRRWPSNVPVKEAFIEWMSVRCSKNFDHHIYRGNVRNSDGRLSKETVPDQRPAMTLKPRLLPPAYNCPNRSGCVEEYPQLAPAHPVLLHVSLGVIFDRVRVETRKNVARNPNQQDSNHSDKQAPAHTPIVNRKS